MEISLSSTYLRLPQVCAGSVRHMRRVAGIFPAQKAWRLENRIRTGQLSTVGVKELEIESSRSVETTLDYPG
ncbi:MAG: hypothetical protein V5A83_03275 [Candidatus Bipolaricaulota bacterium]